MSHAQKCPVCNGSGKWYGTITLPEPIRTCHGCNGKGFVVIDTLDFFSPFQFVITKNEQPTMEDLR